MARRWEMCQLSTRSTLFLIKEVINVVYGTGCCCGAKTLWFTDLQVTRYSHFINNILWGRNQSCISSSVPAVLFIYGDSFGVRRCVLEIRWRSARSETALSFSRNHDLVTQNESKLLCEQFHVGLFSFHIIAWREAWIYSWWEASELS